MKKRLILSVIFVFGYLTVSFSQYRPHDIAHELGFTAGLVSIQSDYGESKDFKSTTGNTGFNVGIVYFADFSYNRGGYFSEHFKVKAELSYTKANFQHYGKYVDPGKTSLFSQQLRAMNGSTSIVNLGAELVWFPLDLVNFNYNEGSFSPYVSIGGQYNYYTPEVKSDLGPMGNPFTTPVKYMDGFTNEPGNTFSFVGSIGTRYKVSRDGDLVFDIRGQQFFSDWVDGLNPDPQIYSENKSNDFLISISVGYIFLLN